MKLLNLIKIAMRSLQKNGMRSFLTMLGIIIGVGSVIALVAIGNGSSQSIQSNIQKLGTNMITIMPEASRDAGVRQGAGSATSLTLSDVGAIQEQVKWVSNVSPVASTQVQVISGNRNWRTSVYGTYPEYFHIRNLSLQAGRLFTVTDGQQLRKVCLVGATVAKELFGSASNVVGRNIRLNNTPFTIIGVLAEKGQSGFGQDQDDIVLAPFATIQSRMLGTTHTSQIYASATSEENVTAAVTAIEKLLRQRHNIMPGAEDDFSIRTMSEIKETLGSVTSALTLLLAAVASISLLVGGVGIMNIMLVSVTERTREIGIRLSVGAKARDILLQFLTESVFLSIIGGLIGVALGMGAAVLVSKMLNWQVVFSTSAVLVSFLFSSAIGVFFGWYPAQKAAKMDPIQALKFD
ncbi:ABC transporter permease [Cesiribacter sp. SM1]|uniref:ABC transporter permease n=1 Tax=Cesiribacter sp. SM1 TaxID=2861196 RepID=UPI001CD68A99|nr:ABC transporter permease [Cesiribacter sp. SM1]